MLLNILNEKWKSKTLAHFYLIECHQDIANKELSINNFINLFLSQVLITTGKSSQIARKIIEGNSHPDIYFVGADQEGNYKVEDLEGFLSFNELAPLELKHKFIIIKNAHLLNQTLANKLLKVLEEPNKYTTIFLLNPRGGELLPTIRSRAIKLKLPWEDQARVLSKTETEVRRIMSDLKNKRLGIAEAMEGLKNIESKVDEEIVRVILEEKTQSLDYHHQEKLLNQIQWLRKSEAYRNSPQERVFGLLEFYLT